MTTKVLTGTYTAGYLLQTPITTLRIAATGDVEGSGVTTPVGATGAYKIFNSGTVMNTTGTGAGINLTHGGRVTNGRDSKKGHFAGGYIYGEDGVSIENARGFVANFGKIVASASSDNGAGVYLGAGGRVTNGSATDHTAAIEGYHGVRILNASGTVDNFGTIEGLSKSAVYFGDGGVVTNGSLTDTSALITGGATGIGVSLNGAIGTVNNFGTITASENSIAVNLNAGNLVNGAVNDTQALIGGNAEFGIFSNYGTIKNFATITANYQGGDIGVSAYDETVVNGSDADTVALIKGGEGANLYGASGTLRNYGTISGYLEGAYLDAHDGLIINGSVLDTGALIQSRNGTALGNAYSGTVWNFGTIRSTAPANDFAVAGLVGRGAVVVKNGSANDARALIEGYTGIRLTSAGVVTNFGTLLGTGAGEFGLAAGIYLADGGTVTNGSVEVPSAQIEGAFGIEVFNAGATVTNFGTIVANAPNTGRGIALVDGGALTNGGAGDITALISGYMAVETDNEPTTIRNFGTISAQSWGITSWGGYVMNGSATDTTAKIEGALGVLMSHTASTLTNFGTITATGNSEAVYLAAVGRVNNGSAADTQAVIDGGHKGDGVRIGQYSVVVQNFATIQSEAAGYVRAAGVSDYVGLLNLTNGSASDGQALIEGYNGVFLAGTGTVTNYGTIEGNVVGSGNGSSVLFSSLFGTLSTADRLVAEAGSAFVGVVNADLGTVEVVSGTSNFTGGIVTRGNVSGAGTLSLSGGVTQLNPGAILTVAQVAVLGSATTVDVEEGLAYAGTWTQTGGKLTVATGDQLSFNGPADAFAGTLAGVGTIAFVGGADTLSAIELTAANVIINGAVVTLQGVITSTTTVAVTTPGLLVGTGGATFAGGTWALSDSASNKVTGVDAGDTLTVANSTVSGAGMLGGGQMILVNKSAGTIDGNGNNALIIDTGANQIDTSGLIEATGAGGVTIQSAVLNGGRLEAAGGTLTANGVVRGAGTGVIASGALVFNSTFTGNVTFIGTSGVLELAKSQSYIGAITGFSHTGGTSLDLGDIAFVGAGEATFSGTATSGVLTVTDGTHTAKITLVGDYTGSTFTASSDGHGGVSIVDPTNTQGASAPAAASASSPHRFIAAMASLGGLSGGAIHSSVSWSVHGPVLVKPRAMSA